MSQLEAVGRYYSDTFAKHGASARGVDWNSTDSQELRFDQLLRVVEHSSNEPFSINDFGCGYGALAAYIEGRWPACEYHGYDIAESMIVHAQATLSRPNRTFTTDLAALRPAEYTVASGIFNVKLQVDSDLWQEHCSDTIDQLAKHSRRGLAFNMLTSYSDPERMRPDLHYADPTQVFDHCKRHLSRNVALLHDYGLYEFSIIVRL